jgi:hypothetical protein
LTARSISANSAYEGGGVWVFTASGVTATFTGSWVNENKAFQGGGIDGSVTLNGSVLIDNVATGAGGGLYGSGVLNFSFVASNSASEGGGVYASGPLTLKGAFVASDKATNGAGAFVPTGQTLTLSQASIFLNSATEKGGGVFNQGEVTGRQSDVILNSAKEGKGIFNEGGTVTLKESLVQP